MTESEVELKAREEREAFAASLVQLHDLDLALALAIAGLAQHFFRGVYEPR